MINHHHLVSAVLHPGIDAIISEDDLPAAVFFQGDMNQVPSTIWIKAWSYKDYAANLRLTA
jgi:hypothetical protein